MSIKLSQIKWTYFVAHNQFITFENNLSLNKPLNEWRSVISIYVGCMENNISKVAKTHKLLNCDFLSLVLERLNLIKS